MQRMAGAMAAVGTAGALVVAWWAQWRWQFAVPRTGALWVLGATLAIAVIGFLAARGSAATRDVDVTRGTERGLVAALCALGIGFRVVHFWTVPAGMNHDAAFNGMFALSALQGAPYTPYIAAAWGRETLFMYICTPLVALLGNVPEAIQLAATLVAIATLPLFYLFARDIVGRRAALVGLGFLAVSGWHGVFSRVGWRMITVPPCELVALIGMWWALTRGARRDWLLAGAGAALSIYTYDAGRVVPLMLAVLGAVFVAREPTTFRPRLAGAGTALVAFLLVGGPMLAYAATHFEQFKGRATHLADEHSQAQVGVVASAETAAALFNYRGNGNDFFIDEPLLEPLAAVLFVLGVWIALRRPADPAHLFLLIGLAMALLPGVLSVPNGNRCIGALPFVYALIGSAAIVVVDVLTGVFASAAARRTGGAVLAVSLLAVAAAESYAEFLGPGRRPILGYSPEATAAGEYMRRFGEDYSRYVVAEDWPEYTLAYLSYNGGGTPLENQYVLGRQLADIEPRIQHFGRKGLLFVTDHKPAGRAALQRLEALFPQHRLETVTARRLADQPVATALIVDPRVEPGESATAGNAFDGGHGTAPGRFDQPMGIAVDRDGQFYVADRNNHRIQAFRRDGTFARAWGAQGSEPGQFREPHDVAVDEAFVYVADLWNQRVQIFTPDGRAVGAITGAPSLSSPRGVCVDRGLVYIAEAAAGRVSVYDRDGHLVRAIGTPGGDAPGELLEPVDVALARDGTVWVVNSGNNRLERFAPDGTPHGAIAIPGWSGNRMKEVSLAIDAAGTLYVGDWDRGAVRRFRADGSELPSLGAGIREPAGIALDGDRLLVVARADDVVRVLEHAVAVPAQPTPTPATRRRR
jgi:sugar lactone lactonase YvrE